MNFTANRDNNLLSWVSGLLDEDRGPSIVALSVGIPISVTVTLDGVAQTNATDVILSIISEKSYDDAILASAILSHDSGGVYSGTLSTNTVAISKLFRQNGDPSDDRDSVPIYFGVSIDGHLLSRLRADLESPVAVSPEDLDELPSPDDDWVAHGHAQSLTSDQQAQARENIGVVLFTVGSGAPSGGADGDVYLRTSNLHLYLKSSGVWTAQGQLVPVI